jgi:iron(III) transport system substrate-binding protein
MSDDAQAFIKNTAPALDRRAVLGGLAATAAGATLGSRRLHAQEAELVLYSSLPPAIQNRLTEAFSKKTGIMVNSLRLITAALAQRFFAEQQSRQYVCDVFQVSSELVFQQADKRGLLADLKDIPEVQNLKPLWHPSPNYFIPGAQGLTIAYNTKLVSKESIPVEWTDIAKPEFKDQIIMVDPRIDGVIGPFWLVLRSTFGDDFLKAVARQRPKLIPAMAQSLEYLAAGEYKLAVPCSAASFAPMVEAKAPAALTAIPSPTTGIWNYSAIAANAPHKDAARKWVQYLLSPEGQEILCKDTLISPLGDIPGSIKAPAELKIVDEKDWAPVKNDVFDLLGLPA